MACSADTPGDSRNATTSSGATGGAAGTTGTSMAMGGSAPTTSTTSGMAGNGGSTSGGGSMSTGAAGASSGGSGGTGGGGAGGSGDAGGKADGGPGGQGGSGGQPIGSDSGAGDASFPPITECPGKPSVDRIQQWTTSAPGEGTTIPPSGNLVVAEGDHFVAKVQFIINNGAYCVCPVYLNNAFGQKADLSTSTGFLLTYSSTADMSVQARPVSHWSGGDQWATLIPSTGGVKKSVFFSFEPSKWKSIFGTPTWTFASTLKEVLGFVFVGNKANVITIYGLRFDGFTPTCR